MPATAFLRANIFMAADMEALVSMFAAALAEHGIQGHFCMDGATPLAGDAPDLILLPTGSIVIDGDECRMVLAGPAVPLLPDAWARVRGYAELVGAQMKSLWELNDDVETECGLSLRERYVLGRRLTGLAPIDIAIESGLTVRTIAAAIDSAIVRVGAATLAEAISFAARRGWLAVTTLQNCTSSPAISTYKVTRNG